MKRANFEINIPKAKSESDEIIQLFVDELNKEWKPYYKVGNNFKKRKPISYMGVKMKLYAIRNDVGELRRFLNVCKDGKRRTTIIKDNNGVEKVVLGSFSKVFYGALKR